MTKSNNDNDKPSHLIEIPYNRGGILDILENGSLYDQLKKLIKGYPYAKRLYALVELCIETDIEEACNPDPFIQIRKGLSDEDFEKYSIIIGLNNVEHFFQKFIERINEHLTSSKDMIVKDKIKYLIDKYGENFESDMQVKLIDKIKGKING